MLLHPLGVVSIERELLYCNSPGLSLPCNAGQPRRDGVSVVISLESITQAFFTHHFPCPIEVKFLRGSEASSFFHVLWPVSG